jgi:putative SOS response-associated peptidase YedK
MCGRFQLSKSPEVDTLVEKTGSKGELQYSSDIAPGAAISIIHNTQIRSATWWLFLDPETLKPNYKYASFNSRSDKLNSPYSIAYKPYRESRCIIPASAFIEALGDKKTYHKVELIDRAIAFGGLCKSYLNIETGELIFSASIITLPPVEAWRNIHTKSIPLMLDQDNQDLIDKWLNPAFDDVTYFEPYLEPKIRYPQILTPIEKPSTWKPCGESFLVTP